MNCTILAVGNLKEAYLRDGIAEYSKRLRPLLPLSITEVRDEKVSANAAPALIDKAKRAESERLLAAITPDDYVIALDLRGAQITSEQFAAKLQQVQDDGKRRLVFVIGGSYGLDQAVTARADFSVCFGKMTYPHQLMRLILAEQIYRACKINRGEVYHK